MTKNATPGATVAGEDSNAAESSRLQGLQAEIRELKRIILTTAKARDEYRHDYFQVHNDYMDFKYPCSAGPSRELGWDKIAEHITRHAEAISELGKLQIKKASPVHPDHPAGSREPPHCSTCHCGLPGEKT